MLALVLDDPDCLNAASIIVERVLERRTPGGGWDRMLGEPHCGCGYPRCSGEAGFMICVLVSGLKRYHHLTGDPAVAEAIIGGARWLINETFDHDSGHFRYTSCAKRTLGGTFQYTQWALEALAAAWELSGDPEIGAYLKRGLPVIGQYPARLSHLGVGQSHVAANALRADDSGVAGEAAAVCQWAPYKFTTEVSAIRCCNSFIAEDTYTLPQSTQSDYDGTEKLMWLGRLRIG